MKYTKKEHIVYAVLANVASVLVFLTIIATLVAIYWLVSGIPAITDSEIDLSFTRDTIIVLLPILWFIYTVTIAHESHLILKADIPSHESFLTLHARAATFWQITVLNVYCVTHYVNGLQEFSEIAKYEIICLYALIPILTYLLYYYLVMKDKCALNPKSGNIVLTDEDREWMKKTQL